MANLLTATKYPVKLMLLGMLAITVCSPYGHCAAPTEHVVDFANEIEPLFKQYCYECHSGSQPEAGFPLDKLESQLRPGPQLAKWQRIAEQIRQREMPPPHKRQPTAEQSRRVVAWIVGELRRAGAETSELEAELAGKYLDHERLFSGPLPDVLNNPPRLWRFSPEIYSRWILRSGGGLAPGGQAMTAAADQVFKDWSVHAVVDEGVLAVALRNAQLAAERATAHTIDEGKIIPAPGAMQGLAMLLDPQTPLDEKTLKYHLNTFAFYRRWGRFSDDELQRYVTLYQRAEKVGGRAAGLRAALIAIQMQPEALYRLELGLGPADERGYRLLGPRELAYSISFAFGDVLDKKVAELANTGKLATRDDALRVIDELLTNEKFPKPRILRFFQEYFAYTGASEVFKDDAVLRGHHAPTLIEDTNQLISYVLAQDRDVLKTLLTTNLSYVAARVDKAGAVTRVVPKVDVHKNYGLNEWPAEQPAALPAAQRAGILTQPSWLVAQSGNFDNHPVQRGRWIREKLLGGVVPAIPITVNAQVPEAPHRTLRDKLNEVTRVTYCWQCHSRMNELGLPFEQYDHLGKYRTEDVVLDPDQPPLPPKKKGGEPIPVMRALALDTTGSIERSGIPELEGPVKSPVELLHKLADSPRVRQVFIRHAFRYWMGRDENLGDAATLRAADEAYVKSGGSMKALVRAILTSDSFLYRTAPRPSPLASEIKPLTSKATP